MEQVDPLSGGAALVSVADEDSSTSAGCSFLCVCPQSSPTPYYTFYYDTGFSDEEEIEEQVLRNTVNSEALMTAFHHHHQPGTNGNKVRGRVRPGDVAQLSSD